MTSGKFATTIGYERRFSPAFLFEERDAFVTFMTHGQPSRPANVENIIAINQGRKPLADHLPNINAVAPDEVRELFAAGKVHLVDIREYEDFGRLHAAGTYNFQLSSSEYEQRMGWVLDDGLPIILLSDALDNVKDAVHKMAFIGIEDRFAGYLDGGIDAWISAGGGTNTLPQIEVGNFAQQLELNPDEYQVLDVREQTEYEEGHIPGAVNMSYKLLDREYGKLGLDPAKPTIVACAGGFRSSTASSLLLRNGFGKVVNLIGGMDAWKAAGLKTI